MSVSIIVASHGYFAKELVKSAELIVGQVEDVHVLSLLPEQAMDDFMKEATEIVESIDGPVIALADLFGGTPSNVLSTLTQRYDIDVVTGLSLPMFIDLYLTLQNEDVEDKGALVKRCIDLAQEAIVHTNQEMIKEEED